MFNESIFGNRVGVPDHPMEPSGPPAVGREGIGRRFMRPTNQIPCEIRSRSYLGTASLKLTCWPIQRSPDSTNERHSDVEDEKQNEEQEDENAKKASDDGTGHCRA